MVLRFAYRLAVKLGHVNVRKMLASISWREFVEWSAFADLEPFDEERQDARLAQVVTTIANANRNPKKRRRPYQLMDFLLRFGDIPVIKPKQTWQEQKAIGRRMYEFYSKNVESTPARTRAKVIRHGRQVGS